MALCSHGSGASSPGCAVCQGPGQAGAAVGAEARPGQRRMPGQPRAPGRSAAPAGQSPAEAVRQPRASAGGAGAALGAKAGEGDLSYRDLLGAHL